MLTQLKRLFGGGQGKSRRRIATAPHPHSDFTPAARPGEPDESPAESPAVAPPINDEDVSIPLQSVLNALPPDLKSHVVPMDLGGATLTVVLQKVLPQLPSGVVKLSFGVLRGAAPQLFSVGKEFDQRDIELPLHELLTRIHPSLLPRPAHQKPAARLMDSIEDSFIVPVSPVSAPQPITRQPGKGPLRVPVPVSAPAARTPAPATPAPAPIIAKQPPSPAGDTIVVPLASLAAVWPPEIRGEIAQLKCSPAQVALPEQLVKVGMKQGKVAFPWQTIRGWIQPAPPSAISKHDRTVLNLPLEVLMPLFISRLKQAPKPQSRLVVDENIPALFGPATPPETPATENNGGSTQPTLEATTSPDTTVSKPKTPGTDFKNRYISPAEVVTRASALNDVAGALVVLPEGLLVAAKVSSDQNPDALAAFLARALGRVNECAEEAQIGELTQLEFTAQNIPWKIFRLHGVLFAAFGRAGGTLPQTQLADIAGEFDRKKRG